MGERRVQSSYVPPDFDPSRVGRRSKPHNGQHDVRFMLPMSIQCSNCGDYMFQGTKANGRKELCYGEFYLDIPVYRFYIHCKNCYSEITIKTDPQNTDYIVEHGATRHFEPWRKVQLENAEAERARAAGSDIGVLESNFRVLDRDMKNAEELERLETLYRKRKRRVSARDLERVHAQEREARLERVLTKAEKDAVSAFVEKREKTVGSGADRAPFRKLKDGPFSKGRGFGIIEE